MWHVSKSFSMAPVHLLFDFSYKLSPEISVHLFLSFPIPSLYYYCWHCFYLYYSGNLSRQFCVSVLTWYRKWDQHTHISFSVLLITDQLFSNQFHMLTSGNLKLNSLCPSSTRIKIYRNNYIKYQPCCGYRFDFVWCLYPIFIQLLITIIIPLNVYTVCLIHVCNNTPAWSVVIVLKFLSCEHSVS